MGRLGTVVAPLLLLVASCGPSVTVPISSESESGDDSGSDTAPLLVCTPGTTMACVCPNGASGAQVCNDAGSAFGACECDAGTTGTPQPTTTPPTSGEVTGDDSTGDDTGSPSCEGEDCGKLDVLFVIDNSGSMAEEQAGLAAAMPLLAEQLTGLTDPSGNPVAPDIQVMVTTVDFGNPLCTPFEPEGYEPARGAPISSACTDRLGDFNNLTGTVSAPEACTNLCPNGVAPVDDFITLVGPDPADNNIPDVPPVDIDGDGIEDGEVAQALACLVPQGINGCGYESQLENMLQALNPGAEWNGGSQPFLRDDANLAIVIFSDEYDCSVKDYSMMENPAFQQTNPNTGMLASSSAICWNAGVECNGPDASGVYSDCMSNDAVENLQPVARYTTYLVDDLRDFQGKEVFMLAVSGIPTVTQYAAEFPHQPEAGGVFDLVYRNWVDGQFPAGDILPTDFNNGLTADDKQFDFGIGPGCTGQNGLGDFTGQAMPPVRVREVCEALNLEGADGTRCCMTSICDEDLSDAMSCMTNLVRSAL